jgi:hypothetical protein
MLRVLVTALLLSAFSAVLVGCHASGSIDTDSAASMHVAK